jgi:hypothetical protein
MAKRAQYTVTINDKVPRGHRYVPEAPMGKDFAPDFKPELTPKQMLQLGVFGGKYMTDRRKEFPSTGF